MQEILAKIAEEVRRNGESPPSRESRERLGALQRALQDQRWEKRLADLRRRAPFQDQPPHEQDRGIKRIVQIDASLRRRRRRAPGAPSPADVPHICPPGWSNIATIVVGGFDFGSPATPLIVPADNSAPPEWDISGNSSVAATYPGLSQMALGVGAGGWCDVVWEPQETFFRANGNRATATLGATFVRPPFGDIAPGALNVSCTVSMGAPNISLVAGDPEGPGGPDANALNTMVYVCAKATLDMIVIGPERPQRPTGKFEPIELDWQIASDEETLLIESGTGDYDNQIASNPFGGAWDTLDSVIGSGLASLSATVSRPIPEAIQLYIAVSVDISAWTLPGVQSVALLDCTGQAANTVPVLSAPLYIANGSTAFGSQPIQISAVQVCGI
jgi:hypothetical protein